MPYALPMMWTELAVASWETIWRRSAMIATGACSAAEYQRMVMEKMHAAQAASMAMVTGHAPTEILRPYHRSATANVRRLRRVK